MVSSPLATGRPALQYKDVCKHDLKAGSLNPTDLEAATADHVSWRLAVRTSIKLSEGKRRDQWEEKRQCREQSLCPQKQSQISPVATATDYTALVLDCLATAGTAIPQQTDSAQILHCLLRQKDAREITNTFWVDVSFYICSLKWLAWALYVIHSFFLPVGALNTLTALLNDRCY